MTTVNVYWDPPRGAPANLLLSGLIIPGTASLAPPVIVSLGLNTVDSGFWTAWANVNSGYAPLASGAIYRQ